MARLLFTQIDDVELFIRQTFITLCLNNCIIHTPVPFDPLTAFFANDGNNPAQANALETSTDLAILGDSVSLSHMHDIGGEGEVAVLYIDSLNV
jgi:hypothetical protein